MFGGFDGHFRRHPDVALRGASKKQTRDELIEKANAERAKRQRVRLETLSAQKIQSCFRSYHDRQIIKRSVREEFDAAKKQAADDRLADVTHIEGLCKRLVFVFEIGQDRERLSWLCQLCVRKRSLVIAAMAEESASGAAWTFRIGRMMEACLESVAAASHEQNLGSEIRLLEVYLTAESYPPECTSRVMPTLVRLLVSRGFYSSLRQLCDARVPPLIEESARPPTPLAETILELIMRPLRVLSEGSDVHREAVMRLSESFFNSAFSDQVRLFVIPALAAKNFPFSVWISVLDSRIPEEPSSFLLYTFLRLQKADSLGSLTDDELLRYLNVLSALSSCLPRILASQRHDDNDDDSDDEAADAFASADHPMSDAADVSTARDCLTMLNSSERVSSLVGAVERCEEPRALSRLASLCHQMILFDRMALHRHKLLHTLAFKPALIRRLWNLILNARQPVSLGTPGLLLSVISRGLRLNPAECEAIVPLLTIFCALFAYLLVTIHDTEFYGDGASDKVPSAAVDPSAKQKAEASEWMPFKLVDLVPMTHVLRDVTLGLIELAFPESRPTIREDYQQAIIAVRTEANAASSGEETRMWSNLFRNAVCLLRQLYTRDTRRQFCPDDHWICDKINLPLDRPNDVSIGRSRLRNYRPFQAIRVFTRADHETDGPPMSTKEVRLATILRDLPYVIAFSQRVVVFHNLVQKDKNESQGERTHYLQGPSIGIVVRRNYLYEDSFEKLSPTNEPNLRLKMRIRLMNAQGLDEAGIDGGGLFREFMTELLKTAFDPNRGFFRLTKDQQLYPNPSVEQIEPNYADHYYFIGRMLGKALFEGHLVELPLASFFLSKLLGQQTVNVDIDHLSSLDPELYRNLLYLKTYDGDVQDLGLDFTIVSEEIGRTSVDNLKENGPDTPVNNENRIEYIHLVADYKLNRTIRKQCAAFRKGLSDVINLDWLCMFSHRELQVLISGAEHDIDLDDLRRNVKYGNGFTDTHPTIECFWKVVGDLKEGQKRALLKFVTSCSRPPLFGFKELDPPFCIQNAGSEPSRLPTASTCMNLLKLPEFKDEETLKTKLLYAIESGAGFELS